MLDEPIPDLDLIGELSDGAIEALAALLIALADDGDSQETD